MGYSIILLLVCLIWFPGALWRSRQGTGCVGDQVRSIGEVVRTGSGEPSTPFLLAVKIALDNQPVGSECVRVFKITGDLEMSNQIYLVS